MAFFELSLLAANRCAYSARFESCVRTSSARNKRVQEEKFRSRNLLSGLKETNLTRDIFTEANGDVVLVIPRLLEDPVALLELHV